MLLFEAPHREERGLSSAGEQLLPVPALARTLPRPLIDDEILGAAGVEKTVAKAR